MTGRTGPPEPTEDPAADWTTGVPRLVLHRCERCGHHRYLPRVRCDACGSAAATAVAAGGEGLCVALTVLHVTPDGIDEPVRLALVELDEGPIAMGRAESDVRGGVRVRVHFPPIGVDGAVVPTFVRKEVPRGGPFRAAQAGRSGHV